MASNIRIRNLTSRNRKWQILGRAGNALKSTLALVGGGVTIAALGWGFSNQDDKTWGKEKRVLVLPFHKMSIVEHDGRSLYQVMQARELGNDKMSVEVQELVNVIHEAAADPNIVALHGIFGEGFELSQVGWAQLEEVRNALRVFRESHRVHAEPNLEHKTASNEVPRTAKQLYAYAHSFPYVSSGSQGYYLASAFTHVHLHPQGGLQLYGLHSSTFFVKQFLDNYGIKVNVFKHGAYKNAPNTFTETEFTPQHKKNVANVLHSTNRTIHDDIAASRGLVSISWNMVQNHGTFTAQKAKDMGFIDYLAEVDPLDSLVDSSKNKEKQARAALKGNAQIDDETITAKKSISFKSYAEVIAKRKRIESQKWNTYKILAYTAKNSSAGKYVLAAFGYKAPFFNFKNNSTYDPKKAASVDEKIAVIRLNGSITDDVARRTVDSLKAIKRDNKVKVVILRINSPGGSAVASELIFQECRGLPQPVVCSFGNVAASGGYYVSSAASRIFALPTTITGSIGVFGVRPDVSELAQKYGVNVGFVSTGNHSATNDIFHPLTKTMKDNIQSDVDRVYDCFKALVSKGRSLPLKEVEAVAQGRIWTGVQAKDNGLVDELGGLQRAVSYARRTYTSGAATVEFWPKEKNPILSQFINIFKSFGGLSLESKPQAPIGDLDTVILSVLARQRSDSLLFPNSFGRVHGSLHPFIYMTCDENLAIECLLSDLATRTT